MATNPIFSGVNPAQGKVASVEDKKSAKIDDVKVAKSEAPQSARPVDSFNIHTNAGRAALQQTMLDLGLSMPEFLSSSSQAFIDNLSSQDRAALANLGQSAASMSSYGADFPKEMTSDLQGRWADFVSKNNMSGGMDVNALVQFVLREAYMENTKDLHFYAQKVRFYNDLKKEMREHLTKARETLGTLAGKADGTPCSFPKVDWDTKPVLNQETGQWEVPPPSNQGTVGTKEGLNTYIENLEEKLNGVGDDAQLANVDLQNMLQKQQQTMQMMSNIAKMLHDTAMAIIRKIGG